MEFTFAWRRPAAMMALAALSAPAFAAEDDRPVTATLGGRLHLDFDIGMGGPGSARTPSGHFSVESGLRFDPGTRGLHMDQPEIVSVDVPAMGGVMNDNARTLLNGWLLDYARQEPIYRLDDSTIGRMASRKIQHVDIDPGTVTIRLD